MNKIKKLDITDFKEKEINIVGKIKLSVTISNLEVIIDKLNEIIDSINYSEDT